jgi:hypothetical protein
MLTEFGLATNPAGGRRLVRAAFPPDERQVTLVDEAEAGAYVRRLLPVARDAGASGALIWCFADYDPAWYGRTPFDALVHERHFGIVDAAGRLKATGAAMRDAARALA